MKTTESRGSMLPRPGERAKLLVLFVLTAFLSLGIFVQQTRAADQIKLGQPFKLSASGVTVTVSLTSIKIKGKDQAAWAYYTKGMQQTKNTELLVVYLKNSAEPKEAFPEGPLKFLNAIANQPETGIKPEVGGWADVTPFVGPRFVGIIYVPFDNTLTGLTLPIDCLAVVPIVKEEVDVCNMTGTSRVEGLMAYQARYFPCPTWCDPTRKRQAFL